MFKELFIRGVEKHVIRLSGVPTVSLVETHKLNAEIFRRSEKRRDEALVVILALNVLAIPLGLATNQPVFLGFGALQAAQGLLVEFHGIAMRQRLLATSILLKQRGVLD